RHRRLVEQRRFGFGQAEQLGGVRGLRFCQFHLAEAGTDDQDLGVAADLFADVFPAPALLALDVEQFFGEVGSFHMGSPLFVMPGLVPGIHVFDWLSKTWMAGPSPALTPGFIYLLS